ncbi:hypothetical protein Syun_024276 [Stephania yunnanensis]|uniref:Uncharacterized protein n=1 Tax=Stephania yunnanensis TaxID=152371 RepID=A0AAP0NIX8_9MAGN
MIRSGSGDRYGSDNEGFIGDAPRLEKGHGTRESLDILIGKAISYNPWFEGVLDGKYDDLSEQSFYMVGGIVEVIANAEKIA